MKHFDAPLGRSLIVMSTVFTLVCLTLPLIPKTGTTITDPRFLIWRAVPIVVVAACALFMVRGYSIGPNAVFIRRLLWSTRLSLDGLQGAEFCPDATRRAWRIFGNGGFFAFTGFYRNSLLGNFRAFVTDPKRTVILRYPNRTVVLSPSDPEEFVRSVKG